MLGLAFNPLLNEMKLTLTSVLLKNNNDKILKILRKAQLDFQITSRRKAHLIVAIINFVCFKIYMKCSI